MEKSFINIMCVCGRFWQIWSSIANCSRWKGFVIVKLHCNSLETFVITWLHGSLTWPYQLFTGKLSQLPINLWKPWNFSTLNDLQCTAKWDISTLDSELLSVLATCSIAEEKAKTWFKRGCIINKGTITHYCIPQQW